MWELKWIENDIKISMKEVGYDVVQRHGVDECGSVIS